MSIISGGQIIEGSGGGAPFKVAGTPTDGTSGSYAGKAMVGALLINTTAGTLYQNTGTQASPVWTAR